MAGVEVPGSADIAVEEDVSRFLLPLTGNVMVVVVIVVDVDVVVLVLVDVAVFIFTKGVLDDTIRGINKIEKE